LFQRRSKKTSPVLLAIGLPRERAAPASVIAGAFQKQKRMGAVIDAVAESRRHLRQCHRRLPPCIIKTDRRSNVGTEGTASLSRECCPAPGAYRGRPHQVKLWKQRRCRNITLRTVTRPRRSLTDVLRCALRRPANDIPYNVINSKTVSKRQVVKPLVEGISSRTHADIARLQQLHPSRPVYGNGRGRGDETNAPGHYATHRTRMRTTGR